MVRHSSTINDPADSLHSKKAPNIKKQTRSRAIVTDYRVLDSQANARLLRQETVVKQLESLLELGI